MRHGGDPADRSGCSREAQLAVQPQHVPGADDRPQPREPGRPSVWFPLLGIAWLGAGPVFMDHADHFGPGFIPMLVWMATVPFAALIFPAAAITQCYRYKDGAFGAGFRAWRLASWIVAGGAHVIAVASIMVSCGPGAAG